MKYISVQPDSPFFLWQLQVQVSNFRTLGIEKDYIMVIGTKGEVSRGFREFADQTDASVVFIPDTRENVIYTPTIRPHLLKHVDIWGDYDVMYHDSDILFNRLLSLGTDKILLSDTKSYIGAQYIKGKSEELFLRMCDVVGIDPKIVEEREESSGGAQYWIPKGKLTCSFWSKVEQDSERLFLLMKSTEDVYSPQHPIQSWAADIWATIWNMWLLGLETDISEELSFCWPLENIENIKKKPIFHLAGVTEKERGIHFFKGDFQYRSPFGVELNKVDGFCYNRYIDEIRRAEKIFA